MVQAFLEPQDKDKNWLCLLIYLHLDFKEIMSYFILAMECLFWREHKVIPFLIMPFEWVHHLSCFPSLDFINVKSKSCAEAKLVWLTKKLLYCNPLFKTNKQKTQPFCKYTASQRGIALASHVQPLKINCHSRYSVSSNNSVFSLFTNSVSWWP